MTGPTLTLEQRRRAEAVRLASAAVRSGGPLSTGEVRNVLDVINVASYIITGTDYFETLPDHEARALQSLVNGEEE